MILVIIKKAKIEGRALGKILVPMDSIVVNLGES